MYLPVVHLYTTDLLADILAETEFVGLSKMFLVFICTKFKVKLVWSLDAAQCHT
jgi:hypothetical protein